MILAAVYPCLSPQPVMAAAVLTLTPDRGGLSTPVTIAGAGFPASTAVAVKIDGAALWSGVTSASGTFTASPQVTSTQTGVRTIIATAGVSSAGAVFTVMPPQIAITPDAGGEGIPIQITGYYFLPGTAYSIYFEQTLLAAGTTSSFGYVSALSVIPSGYSGGRKKVTLTAGGVTTTSYFMLYSRMIALSPLQGTIGSNFVISGSYCLPDTVVSVKFEDKTIGSDKTSPSGGFAISASIPTGYKAGERKITVTIGSVTVTQYYTIVPGQIAITPPTGIVGTDVTVQGNGFNFGEAVTIYYQSQEVTKVTSSSSGNISAHFNVPPSSTGGSFIRAVDAHGIAPPPVKFDVIPTMEITGLLRGTIGASVNVTGYGFSADSNIKISLEGAAWTQIVTSDSQGSIQSSFEILNISGGAKRVIATDVWGQKITSVKSFFIDPAISIGQVTSGSTGTTFTIYGKGFSPEEKSYVLFLGESNLGSVQCDLEGSFEYSGIVPELPGGEYNISVKNSHGSVVYIISGFKILPEVQALPDNGYVGIQIEISGRGFQPGASIDLIWDFPPVSQTITKANEFGTFTGQFTVPPCSHGTHNIVITDGTNSNSIIWIMESNLPPVPVPISPSNGIRIGQFDGQTPTFQWRAVTDLSGVLYRLTIAADEKFKNIVLAKDNLAGNTYTLDKQESLKRGIYFWRVTAIDGAGNESRPAAPFSLQIGNHLLEWLVCAFTLTILVMLAALYHILIGFTAKRKTTLAKINQALLKKQTLN